MEADLNAELAPLPNPPDPTAADEDTVLYERAAAGRARKDQLQPAGGGAPPAPPARAYAAPCALPAARSALTPKRRQVARTP